MSEANEDDVVALEQASIDDAPAESAIMPSTEVLPSSDSSPPRLAIQRLRLENFKSYGGCVDVGPFHKSFSSIVGPNGSGKSNVIDAMLFVFGRRAKQLRHSKLSELLHHSNTYPDVQTATVTVYFHDIIDTGEGDDDYCVVPESEFAVARRAFRNNTSKYYLNDKEVKMATVVDLLKSKGVDLDNNRFLILQGEVEQIAMMKPKAQTTHEGGLLEYLEDIIGSNRHISAIEESSKQVETFNEERSHKLNRVKAADRERDALEPAKVEAEDYLDKSRELLSKKTKLNKAIQFEKHESLTAHKEELEEASQKVSSFRSSVTEKESLMKELETTFNETQQECNLAVKTMNNAKEQYAEFERKDIQLREDIKSLKAKEKKLQGVLKRESKREEESSARACESRDQKREGEEELEQMKTTMMKAEEKFDQVRNAVREKTAPIRQRLEAKQTELLPYSESVNACRRELEVNQSELKLLAEKLEAPTTNLKECEKSLSEMREQHQQAKDRLTSLQSESRHIAEVIDNQRMEIGEKRKRLEELSSSCSQMRRKVEEARAATDDVNTRSRLHSGILQASRRGALRGVIGRLGDLASVEDQYSVAVGAAAGSSLDCIVVKTAENAQACIQFLRQENLGRATFVILDKIEYLRSAIAGWSRSDRCADGPRLFDFLQVSNPEHSTALYYALRDTLVANSLEDARRMAFKPTRQNRVVSLRGELIESSGAMTGGGRGPTRYRLGSGNAAEAQMDPREFQQLANALESARQNMSAEESVLREIQDQNVSSVTRAEELQVLASKAAVEVHSLESRIAYMHETTLPALRKKVKGSEELIKRKRCPDTKRRLELEATVRKAEEQLAKARNACEGLEKEIASLQEQIVAAGGAELQDAKKVVEETRTQMSDLQSVTSRAASKIKAADKARLNAREACTNAEAEIEDTKKSIVETKETLNAMDDDAQQVLEKFKEAEAVHQEWLEKVQSVQSQFSTVKTELKLLKREEVSLAEAVRTVENRVAQVDYELRGLRKEEKNMRSKLKELTLLSVGEVADDEESSPMEVEAVTDPAADQNGSDNETIEHQLSVSEQEQLSMEIGVLESEVSKLSPNLGAIAEYQTKDSEYKSQVNELDALTSSRDDARKQCDSLRKARLEEFMAGFSVITLKLKELYQMITLGGDAELELVDSLDPFSEGIVFSVRPPKKSWKNISNLSGGEKTLSSLALVFALHHFKPTPLYFLDEIDAALDYKNVSIVANYVKERTKNAQFIIISLRNNMFELADRLVGIYKTHNATKSVTVDPSAFVMPSPHVAVDG